jgi:hypothetical protein
LNIMTAELDPQRWGEQHFSDLDLGDSRRNQRAVTVATAMAHKPGKSIPQLFDRWHDVKAAYELFGRPEATPDELQATHRDWVYQVISQPGEYLLIEDTSEMKYGGQGRRGLGRVGVSKDKEIGFQLHSTLATKWPTEWESSEPVVGTRRPPLTVIGLADQIYHVRPARQVKKTASSTHYSRRERERGEKELESDFWEIATTRLGSAPSLGSVRWVRVCDRGSDIFEFIASCSAEGHGFVVRAAYNRSLIGGPEEKKVVGRLFERVRAEESLGEFELELRSRPGQPQRTARLSVSAVRVWLRSPQRPEHKAGHFPPVECTAARVWESEPPEGIERLEWILLCDAKVERFADGHKCAQQYSTRWLVEEFHKALKTGMNAERLQLETAEHLMAATAIQSVVALRLLGLREVAKSKPEAEAAASGLSEMELAVLSAATNRKLETVQEVALALGKQGGHLNRKSDGMPGWLTLWRGYLQLQTLVEGVRIAHKVKEFG